MSLASLSSRLQTKIIGRPCLVLDEVDSTNREAIRQANAGAREGLVIIARRQHQGRGRQERSWYSFDNHSLTMSLLLRPDLPAADIARLTLVMATGVHRALTAFTAQAEIKWPNDILCEGRKLAGILTETQTRKGRIQSVVVGVGINISRPSGGWPREISHLATDLETAAGRPVCRSDLAAGVITAIEQSYLTYIQHGFEPIRKLWWQAHTARNRPVRVYDGTGYIQGIAKGLDKQGALILATPTGIQRVISGDVEVAP